MKQLIAWLILSSSFMPLSSYALDEEACAQDKNSEALSSLVKTSEQIGKVRIAFEIRDQSGTISSDNPSHSEAFKRAMAGLEKHCSKEFQQEFENELNSPQARAIINDIRRMTKGQVNIVAEITASGGNGNYGPKIPIYMIQMSCSGCGKPIIINHLAFSKGAKGCATDHINGYKGLALADLQSLRDKLK